MIKFILRLISKLTKKDKEIKYVRYVKISRGKKEERKN